MRLRLRLFLTVLVAAVPVVIGLALFSFNARRQALLESTYEATVERMEAGGRDACEEQPRRIGRARRGGIGRGRRGRRGPRLRRVYDDAFVPSSPRFGPLEPELRAELEAGRDVAAIWPRDGRRSVIAMRMPWDGPCSVVVVERPLGPIFGWESFSSSVGASALVAALTALLALLALGPVVRRIRALERSVRAQASSGYEADVVMTGHDEVKDLAQAFNDASREIRQRLVELSARDEALSQLLANTTHDVMVPLTVLQGHLSDMTRAARRGDEPDQKKLAAALEEAHYLGALLRNLSAAARLEGGEPMLTRHVFDLRDLLARVVSRHQPLAEQRGVTLDHAVPEHPLPVNADSTLAEQALNNLVHNAIRYNEPGGHVAVVLEPIALGPSKPGFSLRVLDDGPGIPEEELARVSERRFRGGAARQRQPTGMGLGLHIVRDVAEKHHWTLRFESPPTGGLLVSIEGASADEAASTEGAASAED